MKSKKQEVPAFGNGIRYRPKVNFGRDLFAFYLRTSIVICIRWGRIRLFFWCFTDIFRCQQKRFGYNLLFGRFN